MNRRPTYDPRTAAEKAFKAATTKPVEAPPKAGTKPDVPKNPSKSELKAQAGKPAGNGEQSRDDRSVHPGVRRNTASNIASKVDAEGAKAHSAADLEQRAVADDKTSASTVKKLSLIHI